MPLRASRSVRILLVEDDDNDARLIVREFQRAGWDVAWRRLDTEAALRDALMSAVWDLVVTDWHLPSFDALHVLAVLSAVGVDVPCIVASGAVTDEAGARAMQQGARDYIAKANLARLVPAAERELRESDERRRRALLEAALAHSRQAQAEAEAATRARDAFLTRLAHELRTPVTSVAAYASMLRRPDLAPEARRRAFDAIERGAARQARLVEDILDVGRIAAGTLSLERVPTDLAELVRQAVDLVEPLARAAGVRIEMLIEPLATIEVDALRIEQVLWNLLVNALKFTPEHGQIRVRVSEDAETVRLEIADNGKGIAPDMLAVLFEPHRHVSPRAYGGLGLGLTLVRELVHLHGGQVWAASDGPGKGATFTVLLARAAVRPSGNSVR